MTRAHVVQVRRPVVHQAAPTLEEITAGVGRLGGVLYRMGERVWCEKAAEARSVLVESPK